MVATLGRLVVIALGLLAAIGVGGYIGIRIGLERMTNEVRGSERAFEAIFDWVLQGLNLSFLSTVLIALLVVVVGEVARIRNALFYIAGGGLAVAAAPLLIEVHRSGGLTALPPFVWQVFATAGFVAGGIYWLIAGRSA